MTTDDGTRPLDFCFFFFFFSLCVERERERGERELPQPGNTIVYYSKRERESSTHKRRIEKRETAKEKEESILCERDA